MIGKLHFFVYKNNNLNLIIFGGIKYKLRVVYLKLEPLNFDVG